MLVGRDGRAIVQGSVTPLLDAARALLGEGVDPKTKLVMRHAGASHDALRTTVSGSARLTLEEGDRAPSCAPGSRHHMRRSSRLAEKAKCPLPHERRSDKVAP